MSVLSQFFGGGGDKLVPIEIFSVGGGGGGAGGGATTAAPNTSYSLPPFPANPSYSTYISALSPYRYGGLGGSSGLIRYDTIYAIVGKTYTISIGAGGAGGSGMIVTNPNPDGRPAASWFDTASTPGVTGGTTAFSAIQSFGGLGGNEPITTIFGGSGYPYYTSESNLNIFAGTVPPTGETGGGSAPGSTGVGLPSALIGIPSTNFGGGGGSGGGGLFSGAIHPPSSPGPLNYYQSSGTAAYAGLDGGGSGGAGGDATPAPNPPDGPSPAGNGNNGTIGTGSGGGGGGGCGIYDPLATTGATGLPGGDGGSGGSGCLIVRYPTDFAAATVTGDTPVTPQPGFYVYRWNSGPATIIFN